MVGHNGHVLVLCTGNICRSPYIEHVLRAELVGADVTVDSAGTQALAGNPVDAGSALLLQARGIDATQFVARQVTPDLLRAADLVITASREHLGLAAQLAPAVLRKGFALVDLHGLLEGVPVEAIDGLPGANRAQRVARCALARRSEVSAPSSEGATIHDPYRQDAASFALMERQVWGSLPTVIRALRG